MITAEDGKSHAASNFRTLLSSSSGFEGYAQHGSVCLKSARLLRVCEACEEPDCSCRSVFGSSSSSVTKTKGPFSTVINFAVHAVGEGAGDLKR